MEMRGVGVFSWELEGKMDVCRDLWLCFYTANMGARQ